MAFGKRLSFIVPAYNEELNIEPTVRELHAVCADMLEEYEILVIDDHSSDATSEIVQRMFRHCPEVKLFRNERNLGLGGAYRRGIELAIYPLCLMVPGDNAYDEDGLRRVLSKIGETDIVTTYTDNLWVRPWHRRMLSVGFTKLNNFLFGLNLHYYNGISVLPTEKIRKISFGNSFAYSAEILVQLIKKHGATVTEVPVSIVERASGSSKALRPKNIVTVLTHMASLWRNVRLLPHES